MRHNKNFMILLLVLALLFSCLTGCKGGTEATTPAPETTTAAEQTTAAPDTTPAPATDAPATEAPATEPPATEPIEETFLPREPGTRQLTLYWTRPGADINTCDVWMWWDGGDGAGHLFTPCAYGMKCQVNVPESVSEVGFIVRTACSEPGGTSWGSATKDYDGDRFAVLTGEETFIYLVSGDGNQYYSSDGGKTLEGIRVFTMAGIMSETEIQYFLTPATRLSKDQVKVREGGRELAVASLSSENNEVITGKIVMAEPLDITKQYEVEIEGFGTLPALPTGIFDSQAFADEYLYDGDDLGAVVSEEGTTFKLWAPTASQVTLKLYLTGSDQEDPGDVVLTEDSFPMEKGEKGVWSISLPNVGHGIYYTYEVTTAVGTEEIVDPYAKAVGVNGNRGMTVDLSLTDPVGFEEDTFVDTIDTYSDAIIWEVHVRDFSNRIASSAFPGKYLAFTETGLVNEAGVPVGVDYLKDLGITHVHLQPVYDFATVDESSSEPQFNWGYDPKNYNAPEGSYATDPFRGEVRINEFKQMVQALHEAGLGVVMDVVYNHTYDGNSCLNKAVPYYYYRYNAAGENSNGSGCGNETASDRAMFRKYMVDSVTYWAEEYHIDGFRFDLMALHDVETMQKIEQALHAINPKCLIYGEGWTGGTSELRENFRASQANIKQVKASEGAAGSIAVFNDSIRDGLKGSVFDSKDTAYINGTVSGETANKVGFGLTGGVKGMGASWSVENAMVINYMSCHDNLTLWDKLAISCPDASEEERLAMNRFGASIVMFSRGIPLFLAGEEMLRSKDGDENSYKSSDEVNNIDWEALVPGSAAYEMAEFYLQLIGVRKSYEFLRRADVAYEVASDGSLLVTYTMDGATVAQAVVNPGDEAIPLTVSGGRVIWGSDAQVDAKSVTLVYFGD